MDEQGRKVFTRQSPAAGSAHRKHNTAQEEQDIKAAVLYEARTPLVIEELDLSDPATGEVLVKMMASGVCHSDWHVVKGEWTEYDMPIVLGHEGAGIVEAIGAGVTSVKPGDHVILSWRASCGMCEMCQMGWVNLCQRPLLPGAKPRATKTGREINVMAGLGTVGSYSVVPEVVAVKIDEDIPFPQAALVGCGVTTGVGAAINTVSGHQQRGRKRPAAPREAPTDSRRR